MSLRRRADSSRRSAAEPISASEHGRARRLLHELAARGGTLILHHPFELPVYLQQIATEKPEYAIAPPAVLMLLLQNEALLNGVDLSCLRCVGSGSAPLPPG